jgi:hypothetical protein
VFLFILCSMDRLSHTIFALVADLLPDKSVTVVTAWLHASTATLDSMHRRPFSSASVVLRTPETHYLSLADARWVHALDVRNANGAWLDQDALEWAAKDGLVGQCHYLLSAMKLYRILCSDVLACAITSFRASPDSALAICELVAARMTQTWLQRYITKLDANQSGANALVAAAGVNWYDMIVWLSNHCHGSGNCRPESGVTKLVTIMGAKKLLQPMLCAAAKNGHLDMCRLLVDMYPQSRMGRKQRHPAMKEAFMLACQHGHPDICDLLAMRITTRQGRTHQVSRVALLAACDEGRVNVCRMLVQDAATSAYAREDLPISTALLRAATNGHMEVCRYLLGVMHAPIIEDKIREVSLQAWEVARARFGSVIPYRDLMHHWSATEIHQACSAALLAAAQNLALTPRQTMGVCCLFIKVLGLESSRQVLFPPSPFRFASGLPTSTPAYPLCLWQYIVEVMGYDLEDVSGCLHKAIYGGQVDVVQYFLGRISGVDLRRMDDFTLRLAVTYASTRPVLKIAQMILHKIEQESKEPIPSSALAMLLCRAAYVGDLGVCQILVPRLMPDARWNYFSELLFSTLPQNAWRGNLDMCQFLMQTRAAGTSRVGALDEALEFGLKEIFAYVDCLCGGHRDRFFRDLRHAEGHDDMCQHLANPTNTISAAFRRATMRNQVKVCRYLAAFMTHASIQTVIYGTVHEMIRFNLGNVLRYYVHCEGPSCIPKDGLRLACSVGALPILKEVLAARPDLEKDMSMAWIDEAGKMGYAHIIEYLNTRRHWKSVYDVFLNK